MDNSRARSPTSHDKPALRLNGCENQPQFTSICTKVTFSWAGTYFLKNLCIHICNHQSIKVVQFPRWTTILNRFCAENAEPLSTIWSISNMPINQRGSLVKLLGGSTEYPIIGLSNLVRSRKYGHQPTKDVDSALSSDESTKKTSQGTSIKYNCTSDYSFTQPCFWCAYTFTRTCWVFRTIFMRWLWLG